MYRRPQNLLMQSEWLMVYWCIVNSLNHCLLLVLVVKLMICLWGHPLKMFLMFFCLMKKKNYSSLSSWQSIVILRSIQYFIWFDICLVLSFIKCNLCAKVVYPFSGWRPAYGRQRICNAYSSTDTNKSC